MTKQGPGMHLPYSMHFSLDTGKIRMERMYKNTKNTMINTLANDNFNSMIKV